MSMTNGYYPSPIKTRLSDSEPVPKGWRWVELQDVARLESGHTPSRKVAEYWEGGDVPWLSLKDIRGMTSRYVMDTIDKPTMLGIDNSSARVLPKGTVAFCRTASVGNVAILGQDMATSQDFVDWVCGPELLPEFLYEAFKASGPTFANEMQGSKHKTIYMPTVERFKILLPPLSEQKRIADILDKADAIRRKRQETLEAFTPLIMAFFRECFGTSPNEVWDSTPFGDLVESTQLGIVRGSKEMNDAHPFPYLRMDALTGDGDLALNSLKRIQATDSESEQYRLNPGDFLFNTRNSRELVGKTAVWHEEYESAVLFNNNIMRIRFRQMIDPIYMNYLFYTPQMKYLLEQRKAGTTSVFAIYYKNLKDLPVPVPPPDLQKRFADFVTSMLQWRTICRDAAGESRHLVDSLVQRAFKGEL